MMREILCAVNGLQGSVTEGDDSETRVNAHIQSQCKVRQSGGVTAGRGRLRLQ